MPCLAIERFILGENMVVDALIEGWHITSVWLVKWMWLDNTWCMPP